MARLEGRIELLKPHQRSLWWQVEAGRHRVVAGLQRSGGAEDGRTSDWNCRRQGKSERELQGAGYLGCLDY